MANPGDSGIRIPSGLETPLGALASRYIRRPARDKLRELVEKIAVRHPDEYQAILYGWKNDKGFQNLTWNGAAVLSGVMEKLTDFVSGIFGPFREVVAQLAEKVITDVPEIVTDVLDGKVQTDLKPETVATPEVYRKAMAVFLDEIKGVIPKVVTDLFVGGAANPMKWWTQTGERVAKVTTQLGVTTEWLFNRFWMGTLTADEREKYHRALWGLNEEVEIVNFLLYPNDADRRQRLEFLLEMGKFRLPFDLKEIEPHVHTMLQPAIGALNAQTANIERSRLAAIDRRPLWRRALGPILAVLILLAAIAVGLIIIKLINHNNHAVPVQEVYHG